MNRLKIEFFNFNLTKTANEEDALYGGPDYRDTQRTVTTRSKISEVCRKHGISEATFYNWRSKYAGMKVDELKRLKELEYENARLKKIVANQSLEIDAIKDLLTKKF